MLKRRLLKSSKNIKKISILTFAVLSFALAAYAAVTSTGKPLDSNFSNDRYSYL
ncbi:hypothetical protein HMPREF1006_00999 [Synergistes sp. 3_1_syn1]|nr:hypothetical protein HMPREF1006_00999 [Synergistes sp. 3_1_syn1]